MGTNEFYVKTENEGAMKSFTKIGCVFVLLMPFIGRGESVAATKVAAEKGDAAAQCQMGLFYMNGLGVDRDEAAAVEWLKRAAAQNHLQAQYNLGLYYARFSDKEAVCLAMKWLNEAAKQNYADAQFNLAKLYLNHHHPASRERDAGRRAISLLRLAATQGHAGAKEMLEELGVNK